MRRFNVAVIGNGPAGSVVALGLAKSGMSVALIGRPEKAGWKVGETLPPSAKPLLAHLGLLEDLGREQQTQSSGNFSAWEGEAREENFIFNPYGPGWHLDRSQFDQMLTSAASRTGASVIRSQVRGVNEMDGAWQLTCGTNEGKSAYVDADFVVDATGRLSWFARKVGVPRDSYDRLIGTVCLFSCRGQDDAETLTTVEAVASGWWYSALLPGERRVVAFFTDWNLPEARVARTIEGWSSLLRETLFVRKSLREHRYVLIAGPRVAMANSSRLRVVAGEDWLAIGDAAAAHDPLSSQGITSALASAKEAALAIEGLIGGNSLGVKNYSERVDAEFSDYLNQRKFYYAKVRRWPDSEFWRRHSNEIQVIAEDASAVSRR